MKNSKKKIAAGAILVIVAITTGVYLGYDFLVEEEVPKVETVSQPQARAEVVEAECPAAPACPSIPVCPDKVCDECEVCVEPETPECLEPGFCEATCRNDSEEFMKTYRKVRNYELELQAREGQFFTFVRGEMVLVGMDRVNLDSCRSVKAERQTCRNFRRKYHKKMDGIAECDRIYNPIIRNLELRFPEDCN